ncbi:MAG: hypothetical protein HY097_05420 [Nitrospinae bacterium]|nr:hypothetical protein [Nitrospinota bacterium]
MEIEIEKNYRLSETYLPISTISLSPLLTLYVLIRIFDVDLFFATVYY